MTLIALGINHHLAPRKLREQLVFTNEQTIVPLQNMVQQGLAREAALLSTCNRTELYCSTQDPQMLVDFIADSRNVSSSLLTEYLYVHQEHLAISHLLRVASGLDSQLIGEAQILGQIKQAFNTALNAGTLGPRLKRLSHYLFNATKRIRNQTNLGYYSISHAYLAVTLAQHLFSELKNTSALLIGAGETIELLAKYLHQLGLTQIYIANRTFSRAKLLSDQIGATPLTLIDIPQTLVKVDMVFSATYSPLPLLGKGAIERALKLRRRRPMLLIDLAIPSNIEPEVSSLNDVYCYNLDDLNQLQDQNQELRLQAAAEAESLVQIQTAHYLAWEKSLDSVEIIRAYRHHCETLRDEEMQTALRALAQGNSPEKIFQDFAHTLTQKLMHTASVQLREAASIEDIEQLDHAKQLLIPRSSPLELIEEDA